MSDAQKKIKPLREGLWTKTPSSDALYRLIGHTCLKCGEIFFPKKENGDCTYCHSKDIKEVELSTRGKIWSFTVVHVRPPGGFYKGDVPYAMGFVDLEDGARVQGLFTGCDMEKLHVGMNVQLVFEKLHEDDEGNEIITYKFKPAA